LRAPLSFFEQPLRWFQAPEQGFDIASRHPLHARGRESAHQVIAKAIKLTKLATDPAIAVQQR